MLGGHLTLNTDRVNSHYFQLILELLRFHGRARFIFYRSLLISLYDSHAGEHSDVGFCRYDRLHPVCTRRPWRHGGKTASDHVVEQSQTRNPHLYHLLVNLTRFSHL